MNNVTTVTIESLSKARKEFLWGKSKSYNDYENGGLKSVDIF